MSDRQHNYQVIALLTLKNTYSQNNFFELQE